MTRTNKYLLYIISSFFLLQACADKSVKDEEKEDSDLTASTDIKYTDEGASLLYEINGKDLETPSYLYGTIHMIDEKLFSTSEELETIVANSDYLVMEIENITQMSKVASVLTGLQLDSGTVADYVSDSLYNSFLTTLDDKLGISQQAFESQYATMKPFGLYTVVASAGGENTGATKSYELYFMNLAYDHNLQLAGLETIEDQMLVFDQISMEDMLTYMIKMLNDQEASSENEMEKLGRIYASGRLDSISNYLLSGDDMLMTTYKKDFLDQRNSNWIPVIEDLIHQHTCFIAVGAAHLPGETGVIKLLRDQGYTLKAVSID